MNKIVLLVLAIILSSNVSSAIPNAVSNPTIEIPNPVDILSNAMVKGFDAVIMHIADGFYAAEGINGSSEQNSYLTKNMISSNDIFLNNKFVQDKKNMNAFWYAIIFLMYVFIGAVVQWNKSINFFPKNGFITKNDDSDEYFKYIIWGLVGFMMIYYIIDYILKLEYVISYGISSETFDLVPPVINNVWAYLFGAISFLAMSVFGTIRIMVVGLVISYAPIIMGMCLIPYTRGIATTTIKYAIILLFGRMIIAFIILSGTGIIQGTMGAAGVLGYLILQLMVDVTIILLVIGPIISGLLGKLGSKGTRTIISVL